MRKKKVMDMTPVCDKCRKVAPIDEDMSTPTWTVYRIKEPCECGGSWTSRCFLDMEEYE